MIQKVRDAFQKIKEKYCIYMDGITTRIVVIMTVIIIPLNVLVIAATMSSVTELQQQAVISMENLSNLYMQQLDSRVTSVNYYMYELTSQDTDFIRLSEQKGDSDFYRSQTLVAQKFRSNLQTTGNASGYFYFCKDLDQFSMTMPNKPDMESEKTVQEIRTELEKWIRETDLDALNKWNVVEVEGLQWLICIFQEDDFYYGAVLSLDEVIHEIETSVEWEKFQVLINEPQEDRSLLCIEKQSSNSSLTWWFVEPRSEVMSRLPGIQRLSIALALMYLLLIPVLFLILKHILLRPLGRIRNALLKLKRGEQDYRISEHKYAREFREINQNFNEMADNIQQLKIENYEKELEKKETAIRNLQLQIHPHFLLNTFNLLYNLASMKEYASIQKMALYLSEYFRYVFRSGRSLELFSQELKLIKSYLDVSEIRFENRFEVEYNIDEAALDVEVPPLLIHNLVENIMHHGLDMERTVHINLIAHYEDGWAEFLVMDDGTGMPESTVQQINEGIFQSMEGNRVHVGIENSYKRIKNIYGEESSLQVESEPDQGTCFTIRFPYEKKEVSGGRTK